MTGKQSSSASVQSEQAIVWCLRLLNADGFLQSVGVGTVSKLGSDVVLRTAGAWGAATLTPNENFPTA